LSQPAIYSPTCQEWFWHGTRVPRYDVHEAVRDEDPLSGDVTGLEFWENGRRVRVMREHDTRGRARLSLPVPNVRAWGKIRCRDHPPDAPYGLPRVLDSLRWFRAGSEAVLAEALRAVRADRALVTHAAVMQYYGREGVPSEDQFTVDAFIQALVTEEGVLPETLKQGFMFVAELLGADPWFGNSWQGATRGSYLDSQVMRTIIRLLFHPYGEVATAAAGCLLTVLHRHPDVDLNLLWTLGTVLPGIVRTNTAAPALDITSRGPACLLDGGAGTYFPAPAYNLATAGPRELGPVVSVLKAALRLGQPALFAARYLRVVEDVLPYVPAVLGSVYRHLNPLDPGVRDLFIQHFWSLPASLRGPLLGVIREDAVRNPSLADSLPRRLTGALLTAMSSSRGQCTRLRRRLVRRWADLEEGQLPDASEPTEEPAAEVTSVATATAPTTTAPPTTILKVPLYKQAVRRARERRAAALLRKASKAQRDLRKRDGRPLRVKAPVWRCPRTCLDWELSLDY
jgi:hypothetical protein